MQQYYRNWAGPEYNIAVEYPVRTLEHKLQYFQKNHDLPERDLVHEIIEQILYDEILYCVPEKQSKPIS